MYFFAFALLLLTLLLAAGGGILALLQLWRPQESPTLPLVEKAHWGVSLCLLVASACLLHGLYWQDYSLKYVADYTDNVLPLFYRLTAFWAGQPGSMLFWALAVGIMGSIFACTGGYRRLKDTTRLWFWVFFLVIMAFFALLLCVWNNPFIMLDPAPADGNGLNPLLQNPGMIFHPPLLFLGYGGFAVPTCLALAQALSRQPDETRWFDLTRTITLLAWSFLTAGIVLGMWWAYMELGWGGYWAWDPVENASLIPWLVGTAALHTAIVEKRRGLLTRFNVLLMGLTTLTTFFATFLVRERKKKVTHEGEDISSVSNRLDKRLLATPSIAVDSAAAEAAEALKEASDSLFAAVDGFLARDGESIEKVSEANEKILEHTTKIGDYLTQISAYDATLVTERKITALHSCVGDINRVAQLADNVGKYTRRAIKDNLHFSPMVKDEIKGMMDIISSMSDQSAAILADKNSAALAEMESLEEQVDAKRKSLMKDHIKRLGSGECRPESSGVFINLVCNLERVGDHLNYIAHSAESF